MALHPTRANRSYTPQFTLPGGERPNARMEAKLTAWIASYRQQHPEMRNRTVRASYRVNGRSIRVEFPPVGRTAGRREDGDNYARTRADGTQRPGLFSFLFGNRTNSGVTSPSNRDGVNTRAGSRDRTRFPNTGNVVMANGGATRNMAIDSQLRSHLEGMARALGVRVEVFSGGQPERGRRTGSTRHNHGGAADVYVYRNGRRLTGNALAQVVNYWLSNNLGGVGYGMAHGGIHLDRHTNRTRFWAYSGMPSAIRQVVTAELGRNVPALRYA